MVDAETCDDGGTGCNADCSGPKPGYTCTGGSATSATTCATACGDGVKLGAEACDDFNTNAGDGCSATCTIEASWTCVVATDPSVCTPVCGSGTTNGFESCDDGSNNGVGCAVGCTGEAVGY